MASPAKVRRYLLRNTKPIARGKPLRAKKWLARGTKPIPARNEARIRRKAKAYAKVIASDFHKRLRYDAYLRSGGLCECAECREIRGTSLAAFAGGAAIVLDWSAERIALAFAEIPVWLTKKGGEPWRRFRSTDGEVHHTSYHLFGEENPAELELVQWTWDGCHHRIEAEHHTRRRFLRGSR